MGRGQAHANGGRHDQAQQAGPQGGHQELPEDPSAMRQAIELEMEEERRAARNQMDKYDPEWDY